MVLRSGTERNLSLGPAALKFALAALHHDAANAERRAILRALVDRVGETCNLTMLAGAEVLYVGSRRVGVAVAAAPRARLAGAAALHRQRQAVPRAHAEGAARAAAGRTPAVGRDPEHAGRPEAIEKEMRAIVRQGYSLDREEFLLGLIAIAVR